MAIVLIKEPWHTIPKEVIQSAVKQCPDGWGAFAVDTESNKFQHHVDVNYKDKNHVDQIMLIQQGCQQIQVVFSFDNFSNPRERGISSIQPYLSYQDDEVTIASTFIGVVPNYFWTPFGTEPAAKNMNAQLLRSMFNLLAMKYPGKALISNPDLVKILSPILNGNGCYVFIDSFGKIDFIGKEALHSKEYSWGWASQDMGAEVKPEAEKPELPEVKIHKKTQQSEDLFKSWEQELVEHDAREEQEEKLKNFAEAHEGKDKIKVMSLPGAPPFNKETAERLKMKYVSNDGKQIPDPDLPNRMTESNPSFAELTGMKSITDITKWRSSAIQDLVENEKPEVIVALIKDMQFWMWMNQAIVENGNQAGTPQPKKSAFPDYEKRRAA